MNIILAGMPGSGKTTVGRALATITGAKLIDTDAEIVKKYGAINDIFAQYGEEAFRNIETETVKTVCKQKSAVISTGGGCLLREENVNVFKECGKIIYLKTRIETLLKRVEGDSSRPLLKGGAEEKMRALYAVRSPIYEGVADIIVETDGLSPEQIAQKITELLK